MRRAGAAGSHGGGSQPQAKDMFSKVKAGTTEETCDLFERYIKALIRR